MIKTTVGGRYASLLSSSLLLIALHFSLLFSPSLVTLMIGLLYFSASTKGINSKIGICFKSFRVLVSVIFFFCFVRFVVNVNFANRFSTVNLVSNYNDVSTISDIDELVQVFPLFYYLPYSRVLLT